MSLAPPVPRLRSQLAIDQANKTPPTLLGGPPGGKSSSFRDQRSTRSAVLCHSVCSRSPHISSAARQKYLVAFRFYAVLAALAFILPSIPRLFLRFPFLASLFWPPFLFTVVHVVAISTLTVLGSSRWLAVCDEIFTLPDCDRTLLPL